MSHTHKAIKYPFDLHYPPPPALKSEGEGVEGGKNIESHDLYYTPPTFFGRKSEVRVVGVEGGVEVEE